MLQLPSAMAQLPNQPPPGPTDREGGAGELLNKSALLYCPNCSREVSDPLTCGDCSAVICRICGTPLESPDDLALG
jgi:hypothetical protein